MDELVVYRQTVELAPLEDVAKFMLIAPEKAKAQAAEIRAMKNLGVAQEVLAQKEEEQRMLNELILDAGARIGELIKTWPKASGGQPFQKKSTTDSVDSSRPITKKERGAEYGFTEQDMARYERLYNNKDLIEEEKTLAREEGRMPTRTNVLEKAKEKEMAAVFSDDVREQNIKYIKDHIFDSKDSISKALGISVGTAQYWLAKIKKEMGIPIIPKKTLSEEEIQLRKQIEEDAIKARDKSVCVEFTIDMLIESIQISGKEYVNILKNSLVENSILLVNENRKLIADEITSIVEQIEKIKELVK